MTKYPMTVQGARALEEELQVKILPIHSDIDTIVD